MKNKLISPLGGKLQNLLVDKHQAEKIKQEAESYKSITLSNRQLCDLEMLASGAYSPLVGFMDQNTYNSVVENLHLSDNTLWPIPIVLDVSNTFSKKLAIGSKLALNDSEGFMLASLEVTEMWTPDKSKEASHVYGTTSKDHSGVEYLYDKTGDVYISGKLSVIQLPEHYVFDKFRHTPSEMRNYFIKNSWTKILGYQTSTPIHCLHKDMLVDVAKAHQTQILIQPTVGSTKPGDTHYFHRVKCYESVMNKFPLSIAKLSLMPHSMRLAGPRETLLHAIVHQNYGCTHLLVGPNHASPAHNATDDKTEGFYEKYAAQQLFKQYEGKLAIEMIAVEEYQYQESSDRYSPVSVIKQNNEQGQVLTEQEFRHKLYDGLPIPSWYSFPEVIQALKKTYKPRSQQGFTLFFTGLSGSGKSTIAKIVYAKLVEHGNRPVTLLDGDVVRLNLSSELGFSKPHRDLNIRRIGFVANEITKNNGVAICAPIAPYAKGRRQVRELIEQHGFFIEIHVSTPLEVCEARDRKGLYAKARKGIIPEFTGISDPYETPENPELNINTSNASPLESAQQVVLLLFQKGFLD